MEKSRSPDGSESLSSRIFSKEVVKYSLVIGIIGGTIINLINQGEAIAIGDEISTVKILLTYIVFYCMATYLVLKTG